MASSLSHMDLFTAAASYAAGVGSLRDMARQRGVPVALLRRELAGIRRGDLNSLAAWLDAVPSRRAAMPAIAKALEEDVQKFIAEFEKAIPT